MSIDIEELIENGEREDIRELDMIGPEIPSQIDWDREIELSTKRSLYIALMKKSEDMTENDKELLKILSRESDLKSLVDYYSKI